LSTSLLFNLENIHTQMFPLTPMPLDDPKEENQNEISQLFLFIYFKIMVKEKKKHSSIYFE